MNQELLCTWLGLPKTAWPPDARTLLGLPPDANDLADVEKRVHDRMAKLRTYQLSYPVEATEGMNRLAEAFINLTEACSKHAKPEPAIEKPVAVARTRDDGSAPSSWREEPPPVRLEPGEMPETLTEEDGEDVLVALPFAPPAKPLLRALDPVLMRELAEESDEATSDLATLQAVIERVDRTRLLLHAWDKLAKPLTATSTKIAPRESEVFAARLDKIVQAMQGYPAFLGQPGKPGYRVVVQARLRMPLAMVRGMTEEQRADLLFDWQAGRQVLLLHRKYLRRLFRSMRHRTAVGLFWHAVRAIVNDHPLWSLAGAALLVVLMVGVTWMLR